jgi:hypothetical protein
MPDSSQVFRAGEIFGLETIGTIGTSETVGTVLLLGVFKAMAGLDPIRFYAI